MNTMNIMGESINRELSVINEKIRLEKTSKILQEKPSEITLMCRKLRKVFNIKRYTSVTY